VGVSGEAIVIGPRAAERRHRSQVLVAGVLCAVLLSGVLIMSRTRAAFSGTADNPSSSWAAGTVVIGDDDSGSALFSATGLLPGDTGEKCIRVTYSGSLAASVRFYSAGVSGLLAPYIDLVVQEATTVGNVGSYGSGCAGFAGTTIYTGTLADLPLTASSYAAGRGSFAPASGGEYRVYRLGYTVNASAPSAAQGQTATATFTWESRS
jgi:hypothetical protein